MLSRLCLKQSSKVLTHLSYQPYTPHQIQPRDTTTSQGYYKDPNEVASKLCRLVAMHENTLSIDKIDLDATWH
jgi:hypothetical protein